MEAQAVRSLLSGLVLTDVSVSMWFMPQGCMEHILRIHRVSSFCRLASASLLELVGGMMSTGIHTRFAREHCGSLK